MFDESVLNLIPVYVLVLFRIAGMMIYAPLLGSSRIPRRVKALMACVLAAGMLPGLNPTIQMPTTPWGVAIAIGGEIIFGLAIGMIVGMIFVAAQWSGEMIGQQMGLNMGQTLDPQFGSQGSVVGDAYFFLALVVFLSINGHHTLLRGVRASFDVLPLMSVGMGRPLLDLIVGLFSTATVLAMQLAAPVLVTMLIVDLILGFIGKTVPQLNIMTAGVSLRSMVGLVVLIVGLGLTSSVMRDGLLDALHLVYRQYATR